VGGPASCTVLDKDTSGLLVWQKPSARRPTGEAARRSHDARVVPRDRAGRSTGERVIDAPGAATPRAIRMAVRTAASRAHRFRFLERFGHAALSNAGWRPGHAQIALLQHIRHPLVGAWCTVAAPAMALPSRARHCNAAELSLRLRATGN